MTDKRIAQLAINTIRTLSLDAIQQANSGHPGTPMGMAPVVYCLWQRFLRFDPEDPIWPNRDRFVLPLDTRRCCSIRCCTSPTLDRAKYGAASGLARGAYILADAPNGNPDVLLLATGSEVVLCVQAYEQLAREGIKARVVSMPCWRLFEAQDRTYRDSVLPPTAKARVSVEEASSFGWERYVGENGESLGMHFFGASAPLKTLQTKFGFTPEHVVEAAKVQLRLSAKITPTIRSLGKV